MFGTGPNGERDPSKKQFNDYYRHRARAEQQKHDWRGLEECEVAELDGVPIYLRPIEEEVAELDGIPIYPYASDEGVSVQHQRCIFNSRDQDIRWPQNVMITNENIRKEPQTPRSINRTRRPQILHSGTANLPRPQTSPSTRMPLSSTAHKPTRPPTKLRAANHPNCLNSFEHMNDVPAALRIRKKGTPSSPAPALIFPVQPLAHRQDPDHEHLSAQNTGTISVTIAAYRNAVPRIPSMRLPTTPLRFTFPLSLRPDDDAIPAQFIAASKGKMAGMHGARAAVVYPTGPQHEQKRFSTAMPVAVKIYRNGLAAVVEEEGK